MPYQRYSKLIPEIIKMNKKADVYIRLIEVAAYAVLAVMIGLFLLKTVQDARDPSNYQKDYLAKDIAGVLDMLYAAPHSFDYTYRSQVWNYSDYIYEFGESTARAGGTEPYAPGGKNVFVIDEESASSQFKYSPYFPDAKEFSQLEKQTPKERVMLFGKEGNHFWGSSEASRATTDPLQIDCDESLPNTNTIVIDPGHGSGGGNTDTGFVSTASSNFKEEDRTALIAGYTKKLLEEKGKNVILTRNTEEQTAETYKSPEERNELIRSTNPDMMISLHMDNRSDGNTILKAYYPIQSKESRNAACRIVNTILREEGSMKVEGIDGASLIPVNLASIGKDSPMYVLNTTIPSVVLELGSVNALSSDPRHLTSAITQIPNLISEAIP